MRGHRPLIALVFALYGAAIGRDGVERWVQDTRLPSLIPETSVVVTDRNGALLRAFTVADGRWRLPVDVADVDPAFVELLIAYEDKRFRAHSGVDLRAAARAAWQAALSRDIVSGASTLSMQVARLLEDSGTGAWRGKLRQIRVALALEDQLSKEEILKLYLTLAPYGGNLEGIRAATLSYFGKEPRRLTPAEAALLVALPQSPARRRPDVHPQAAQDARERVLKRAVRTNTIARDDAIAALGDPVPAVRKPFPALAAHLAARQRQSAPGVPAHRLTLDKPTQHAAETLAERALRGGDDRASIAMILADHHTGQILAHVGSGGLQSAQDRQGFVDMTRAVRSPGSTLKPLVYALAFDQGLVHPATIINDRPVAFGLYAPQNFDGAFRGDIRVDEALRQSLNIPVVLLTDALGPARLAASMRAAGMRPRVPGGVPGLAVALGGVGVTLEDLTMLYAGLAQGGQVRPLTAVAGDAQEPGAPFVSRAAAWHIGHVLGGLAPPPGAAKDRIAYKTGTSYGHRDAWAIGFDGRYVAAVWMGRPDGTPVPGAFGGDLAAPVLFELFGLAASQAEPLPAPPPEALLLDTSELPQPLQRFRGRRAAFEQAADAPKLAFPPDGARLARVGQGMTAKLRDGVPPFTWLADGAPVLTGSYAREVHLPIKGRGFVRLSVIDAEGRAARATVRLE